MSSDANGAVKGRDEFLKEGKGRKYAVVDGYRLRSMTALELEEYRALARRHFEKTKAPFPNRFIVVRCMCDEHGDRLFSNDEVDLLEDIDSGLIEKMADVCNLLCGLEAGSVERYLKNYDSPAV